jgi:hypothetical protein
MMRLITILLGLAIPSSLIGSAVESVFKLSSGQHFKISLAPTNDQGQAFDGPIPLNKMFTGLVRITTGDSKVPDFKISFDARMPAHNHGMITKPRVVKKTANEFLIEGLKFHMAGDWLISFKIQNKQYNGQVEIPLKL